MGEYGEVASLGMTKEGFSTEVVMEETWCRGSSQAGRPEGSKPGRAEGMAWPKSKRWLVGPQPHR